MLTAAHGLRQCQEYTQAAVYREIRALTSIIDNHADQINFNFGRAVVLKSENMRFVESLTTLWTELIAWLIGTQIENNKCYFLYKCASDTLKFKEYAAFGSFESHTFPISATILSYIKSNIMQALFPTAILIKISFQHLTRRSSLRLAVIYLPVSEPLYKLF